MRDQMQDDTDAGFLAYIFANPQEFVHDLAVLAQLTA